MHTIVFDSLSSNGGRAVVNEAVIIPGRHEARLCTLELPLGLENELV